MYKLFEVYGVELEYMIVNRQTLDVNPIADKLFYDVSGNYSGEFENGDIAWSNELVNHVIEFKTNGPVKSFDGLDKKFHKEIIYANSILDKYDSILMPTGAHPWFNPDIETVLWSHDSSPIYNSYNKIFNCNGHGWSNLQSTHLNLPFSNDEEFGRLHAAIRLIMPIIPALSASTPVIEMKHHGLYDARMEYYLYNSKKIPSLTGSVIPENVFTIKEYKEKILQKCFDDIKPYDTENILQDEFINSRGAIARFGRGSIEIRIIDIQENPIVDITILNLICEILKNLVNENIAPLELQKKFPTEELKDILHRVWAQGSDVGIFNKEYLSILGYTGNSIITSADLWQNLIEKYSPNLLEQNSPLKNILKNGCLAKRILNELGKEEISKASLKKVYEKLIECLSEGKYF